MVSHELKIAFSFLLLQYDWRLEEGPTFEAFAVATTVNKDCKVTYRRRESEVDL